jgi:hypothetical protein
MNPALEEFTIERYTPYIFSRSWSLNAPQKRAVETAAQPRVLFANFIIL